MLAAFQLFNALEIHQQVHGRDGHDEAEPQDSAGPGGVQERDGHTQQEQQEPCQIGQGNGRRGREDERHQLAGDLDDPGGVEEEHGAENGQGQENRLDRYPGKTSLEAQGQAGHEHSAGQGVHRRGEWRVLAMKHRQEHQTQTEHARAEADVPRSFRRRDAALGNVRIEHRHHAQDRNQRKSEKHQHDTDDLPAQHQLHGGTPGSGHGQTSGLGKKGRSESVHYHFGLPHFLSNTRIAGLEHFCEGLFKVGHKSRTINKR